MTVQNVFLEVPQDVLDSARLTLSELRVELGLCLYAQGRLSVGKARELTGKSLWEFRQLIASRGIPVHLEIQDIEEEVEILRVTGRL
jgi:predicted HTH domain antitoxin